jgi:uncharacterized protein (TIGR02996 family)
MEDEGFLQAIQQQPGDWPLRLIYADWLEERGDPRGELLRLESALRSTPFNDPRRQALGERWRALRATLPPEWLTRVRSDAVVPPWLSPVEPKLFRAGLLDYYHRMNFSHYDWVILAVLAPIEAVARTLIESRGQSDPDTFLSAGRWLPNVPVQPGPLIEPHSGLVPLVHLRGHAWTVAEYDTFGYSWKSQNSALKDAWQLSSRLGTTAIEFTAEESPGRIGYQLFVCGDLVEMAQWNSMIGSFAWNSETGRFASKDRSRPPWSAFPRDYPDELFQAIGLYIPPLFAPQGRVPVVIDTFVPEEVERCDLLDLQSAFDDRVPSEVHRQQEELFRQVQVFSEERGIPKGPRPGLPNEDEVPF